MKKLVLTVIMTAMMAAPAWAAEEGFYIGAQAGKTRYLYSDSPNTVGSTGLFAGYMFTKNLGMEAGYRNFDRTPSNLGMGGYAKSDASYLAGNFILPFTDNLSWYSRIGIASVKTTGQRTWTVPLSGNKTFATIGGGLQYNFTKNVGMRAGVEIFRSEVTGGGTTTGSAIIDGDIGIVGMF